MPAVSLRRFRSARRRAPAASCPAWRQARWFQERIQLSRTSGTGKLAIRRAVSLGLNWSAILFNNSLIREVEWLLPTPRPAGHAIPRRDWTAARPFSEPAIEHPEPNLATRL